MPMPFHLEVEGTKQGPIQGSCAMEGREDTILCYGFEHKVHIPRDPQLGLASGKRIHSPLTIIKEYDKSSPKLFQALCTGEHLNKVVLKWYIIEATGKEEHYFTHTLENAIVVTIKPYTPLVFLKENEPYRHMEEVSFTYQKIKWTWELDGIESEDDWTKPGGA